MPYNRDIYFDNVRASLFGGSLTQQQVDGQEALLGEWEEDYDRLDVRWLAYILATTIHETANKMWPVTEYGSASYLQSKPYWPYIGRGFVQLTWKDNYAKATTKLDLSGTDDLVKYPDRALDLVIASDIIIEGMIEGWFTGKKLGDYFNSVVNDPYNARRIVNGTDKADLISGYHSKFLSALNVAKVTAPPPEPEPLPTLPPVQVGLTIPIGQDYEVFINNERVLAGRA